MSALQPDATPRPAHDHEWRLVAVEYDDLVAVGEIRCVVCDATLFE